MFHKQIGCKKHYGLKEPGTYYLYKKIELLSTNFLFCVKEFPLQVSPAKAIFAMGEATEF